MQQKPVPDSLTIAPESLEVANCYLEFQNIQKTADTLGMSVDLVTSILERREVKSYIDNVFLNIGFNNRFVLRNLMDTIIKKKLEEMDAAGVGSSKDIIEILSLSHKMTMDHMAKEIELEKLRQTGIKNQTNIQINDAGGSNYSALLAKLLKPNT
jgi:Na+-transporting NADH:ubiquinone oxidoreductase subunit NqrA